jgi:hypothetical protein
MKSEVCEVFDRSFVKVGTSPAFFCENDTKDIDGEIKIWYNFNTHPDNRKLKKWEVKMQ